MKMKLPQVLRSVQVLICLLLLSSCVSRKEIVYFQGLEEAGERLEINKDKSLKIKPNDLLTITVSAPEQAAAMPFNLPVMGMPQEGDDQWFNGRPGSQQLQTYLVDADGNIEFPILGTVNVAGLSRQDLQEKLKLRSGNMYRIQS